MNRNKERKNEIITKNEKESDKIDKANLENLLTPQSNTKFLSCQCLQNFFHADSKVRPELTERSKSYLQRIKLSTIEMLIEFICGVLPIKSDQNTILILHPISPKPPHNSTSK